MTYHLTSAFAAAFAGALAAGSVGCNAVECGLGTVEEDGVCVPEQIVTCDPDTTREEVNPTTGVITCIGTGGPDCDAPLPCPAPVDGKITICGRLLDAETDAPIQDADATGGACDPANPTAAGPCSMKLKFVDALEFAMMPGAATAHIPATFILDDCGRYVATDLQLSSFGFSGLAIDDANGTADRHVLTEVALDDDDAQPAEDFAGYVARNETDMAWHTSSGIGGSSFNTRGVVAFTFRHGTTPVAGVQVRRDGQPIVADDYYFNDPGATTRASVAAAQSMTGVNGSALALSPGGPGAANYDAVGGGLPAGCRWPTALAFTIPGVVFVQIKVAETTAGAECP